MIKQHKVYQMRKDVVSFKSTCTIRWTIFRDGPIIITSVHMRDYNKAHTYCPSHDKFRPFDITGGKNLAYVFWNFKKCSYYGSLLFVFGRLRYQLTTVVIE